MGGMKTPFLGLTAGELTARISCLLITLSFSGGLRISAATWGPFTYEREGDTVRIQWVRGFESPDRRLVIPESIEGLPVTAIEGLDVSGMSIIREVVIPSSVISTNPGAFWGTALERIEVSPLNPAYLSQDGVLFNHERTRLVRFPSGRSGEYSVPEGVTHIGDGGFAGCSGLTRVAIPASAVQIEDTAFFGCSALTGIELPAALSRIGRSAFAECTSLIDVSIPDSVTQLGNGMFEGCLSLTHASIGDGATAIGDWTFQDCPNLVRVSLGRQVSRLGESALGGAPWLQSIDVAPGNPSFTSRQGILFDAGGRILLRCPQGRRDDLVIPAGTTSIAPYAFMHCLELRRIFVPPEVTMVGESAFDTRVRSCWLWGCSTVGANPDVYFLGDAPAADQPFGPDFAPSIRPSVFYRSGTLDWTEKFDRAPTIAWSGQPILLRQPKSVTVIVGSRVQLSVQAFGREPLTFEWRRDGQSIPGATNPIVNIGDLDAARTALYQVVVSSPDGVTTSDEIAVTARPSVLGSYEAAVWALRPLAFWPLDEGGGNTRAEVVRGATGAHKDLNGEPVLTIPGATTSTGTGLYFSGNNWVEVEPDPGLEVGAGDFTVAAWIYAQGGSGSIIARGDPAVFGGWMFGLTDGALRLETFQARTGDRRIVRSAPGVVTLDEWQHVVVSCRRDPAVRERSNTAGNRWTRIYRNGVLVASGDIGTGDIENPDCLLTLAGGGRRFPGPMHSVNPFGGGMDDVALFGKALSAEQVADLYAAGIGVSRPLRFTRAGERLMLTWSGGVLQSSTTLGNDGQPAGWADLTAATSPLTLSPTNSANFFRVRTP